MSFGERLAWTIVDAETERTGYVAFAGLAQRLGDYLDESERARFLADASKIANVPVTDLASALYYLLPVDECVILGTLGFHLKNNRRGEQRRPPPGGCARACVLRTVRI